MSGPDVDVAIVGGGIGGIYAGWRLVEAPIPGGSALADAVGHERPSVAVFEASRRIGGRLMSALPPSLPITPVELGGMRYVSPSQRLIAHLVEDVLRLPVHEQVVDVPGNIAYLRSTMLRMAQLATPKALPYWLDPAEAAWINAVAERTPAALIARVLSQVMPGITEAAARGEVRQFLAGIDLPFSPDEPAVSLWRHGFWNLLAKGMSPDALTAAKATIGYDCLGGNYNALDLTAEYFGFTRDVHYRMVDQGYERVPYLLAERFLERGGAIHYRHRLHGIEAAHFDHGPPGVRLSFDDGRTKTARVLLLAMPPRAIDLLSREGPVLGDKRFAEARTAVTAVPLFKLFLLYKECWWHDSGVMQGRSLTDLPLRQCYYWPLGPDRGAPTRHGPGIVMAYDDLLNVSFWSGLDPRPTTFDQRPQWMLFQRDGAPTPAKASSYRERLELNWTEHAATKPMVAEMHRQLMQMHGVDRADPPCDAAFMDWTRDPFGGGVHLWNPGYDSATKMREMTRPVADFPCYLCGEAFSINQTWAEGALQTAELVLQDRFGLPARKATP